MSAKPAAADNRLAVLPPGWALADIQSIAAVNPGNDKVPGGDSVEVSFVPMAAVEAGTGVMDVSTTRLLSDVRKGYTPFREGDVLFAKITPCMENGKIAVVPALRNGLGFGSTEFHVLRPHAGVSARYLYYFLSSLTFRRNAEHNMTGAVGQRRVPTSYIAEHPVPLPPSGEQSRLAAKLDELFSDLNDGLLSMAAARQMLAVYEQAVLKAAFEGRLAGPAIGQADGRAAAWPLTALGDLLSHLTSGSRGWARYYSQEGDLFIRAQNLKHDRLSLDDIARVSLPAGITAEGTRTRVQVGDVLVTITGANVTKTGIVTGDLGTAYVSQHVALARPKPRILPKYLYWYLIAEAGGRRQLNAAAYGAGKPGLNLDNIRAVTIPLPDLHEQRRVVEAIIRLLSIAQTTRDEIVVQQQRAEALREAIFSRAFTGRLLPQDPGDERAAALLERIAAERSAAGMPARANSKSAGNRKRKSAA